MFNKVSSSRPVPSSLLIAVNRGEMFLSPQFLRIKIKKKELVVDCALSFLNGRGASVVPRYVVDEYLLGTYNVVEDCAPEKKMQVDRPSHVINAITSIRLLVLRISDYAKLNHDSADLIRRESGIIRKKRNERNGRPVDNGLLANGQPALRHRSTSLFLSTSDAILTPLNYRKYTG